MSDEASNGPDGAVCEISLPADSAGVRLDKALADAIPTLSRARVQDLIKNGAVEIDGAPVTDIRLSARAGAAVRVTMPELTDPAPAGEAIALDVLFEDSHLIVVNKPAGMVVHPSAGHAHGTLVNALIAHCGASLSGVGGVRRPGIVHRLDRDTSGVLVVAKTDAAHQGLAEQFAAHGRDGRLERRYRALVWGAFDRPTGTITTHLARSEANRQRMRVVPEGRGRHAVTHYRVTRVFVGDEGGAQTDLKGPSVSELEVALETGRTHQIRVHLAHIRHPVLGDPLYGATFQTRARNLEPAAAAALTLLNRQALHAESLGFVHPVSGDRLSFEAPLPADMAGLIDALR